MLHVDALDWAITLQQPLHVALAGLKLKVADEELGYCCCCWVLCRGGGGRVGSRSVEHTRRWRREASALLRRRATSTHRACVPTHTPLYPPPNNSLPLINTSGMSYTLHVLGGGCLEASGARNAMRKTSSIDLSTSGDSSLFSFSPASGYPTPSCS